MKMRTQFALVTLAAILMAFSFFELLWLNRWNVYEALQKLGVDFTYCQLQDEEFGNRLVEEALKYDLPEDEEDEAAVEAIQPYLDLADEYTSIYLYDIEDGTYKAGRYAASMEEGKSIFAVLFGSGYHLTNGNGEYIQEFPVRFRNGTALVHLNNYQRTLFIYPWSVFCLIVSILLFLIIVVVFVGRKIRSVNRLKEHILVMASGDLAEPVPSLGRDEIGILARELDRLRRTLDENITKEQESRNANQDLITALSHDLRTPLTILTGYLEVLRLGRNPSMQEEYLSRCIQKTEDIKELTDRMFEYALVFEENETPQLSWLSTDLILGSLKENCDFIRLAGFDPRLEEPEVTGVLMSDPTMLKRIFSNLFSNILKYGDKGQPVRVTAAVRKKSLTVAISNFIKKEHSQTSSNNIGLKSVQKMMEMLGGAVELTPDETVFTVTLTFPLQ